MILLKNIFEDSRVVFSYINSQIPLPCHKDIVDRVKQLSESKNMKAKIFLEKHDSFSAKPWFDKMFPDMVFEETKLKTTDQVLDSIRPYYTDVLVVENRGQLLESNQIPNTLKEFQESYNEFLSTKDSRKLFSLVYPPKKYTYLKTIVEENREKYFNGETFRIGSVVESQNCLYEILDRGNNYVVLVNESGDTSKKFLKDIQETDKNLTFQEGLFKGHKPSDMFYSRLDIVESFEKTIQDYNNNQIEDAFAILKSIKSIDNVLNGIDENIGNIQYSLDKICQTHNHPYLEEMISKDLQTQTNAAQIIASAIGSSTKGSPTEIVNNAIKVCLKSNNPSQRKVLIKMLSTVENIGVKYDKTLLESTSNDIHREFMALRRKTTDQVLQDHKDMRNLGPDYSAKDVGGKREMIKDILSHRHGASNLKTYKNLKADIRRQMDEENLDELSNETLKSYTSKAMSDTFTPGKKNRNPGMQKAFSRLSGTHKPLLDSNKKYLGDQPKVNEDRAGIERGGEYDWHQNITNVSQRLSPSRGHRLIDKSTNKTISTHKTVSDAIAARKKLRGNSDTHSIQAIQEVHENPDYDLKREVFGYDKLKQKLAQATGILNYDDQEPGKDIQLIDFHNNPIFDTNVNKPGHSFNDVSNTIRKMKVKKHLE